MNSPTLKDLPKPPDGRTGWPWDVEANIGEIPSGLPKISIVTPSFNQCDFIEETIRSVLLQGYPDLEYIIIDGGSTDGTADIIKKYEKFISFWVSEPDNGQAEAIRKGFEHAAGNVMAWINSDDVYSQNCFIYAGKMFRDKDIHVVYGDEFLIDNTSVIVGERRLLPYPTRLATAFFVYGGFWVYQPASFWTKELYEQSGGIDIKYRFVMDPDLFIRFSMNTSGFKHIKEHLVSFRLHNGSKTCTLQEVRREEREMLKIKYNAYIHPFLRNSIITKLLGWGYFLRHFIYGNAVYAVHALAKRLGLARGHELDPY